VDAAARREARKHWQTRVFRTWEEAAELDVLFWSAVPEAEQARVARERGEEMGKIARLNKPVVTRG
jgi:hypothetical protein